MNDNYCDQSDGSDELLTSACSYLHVKYSCTLPIKGVFEQIPTSRVQDGNSQFSGFDDIIGFYFYFLFLE